MMNSWDAETSIRPIRGNDRMHMVWETQKKILTALIRYGKELYRLPTFISIVLYVL